MALRRQIIDFVWLHVLHDLRHPGAVGHVALVENERSVAAVLPFIQAVKPRYLGKRKPTQYSVNSIAFAKEQFRQVVAILSSDARDQRNLGVLPDNCFRWPR